MALIVEDGTIVAEANSYNTLDEIKSYLTDRGVTIPSDDVLSVYAIKAMDYLEARGPDYVGRVSNPNQPLQWPRISIVVGMFGNFPSDTIPEALKKAHCQLVIEQINDVELMPTTNEGGYVTRDQTDVLITNYSESINTLRQPYMPIVEAFLRFLVRPTPGLRNFRA